MQDPDHRRADVEAGRRASRDELRHGLRSASPGFLEGALDNPDLGPDELVLALRNRAAEADWLGRVGRDRAATSRGLVRKLLVMHPNTPRALAQNLLPFLRWADLAEVTRSPGTNPVTQRQAERLIRGRLAELSSGEKTSLARTASRGLIPDLIACDDERVLRSLLHNPRLVEREAVRIVERPGAGPALIDHLVTATSWGARRSVRLAVLECPRTPAAVALRLVGRLDRRDLQSIAGHPRVPRLVKIGARRRLAAGGEPRRAGGRP